MARRSRTKTYLEDDIDGTDASHTVTFRVDGLWYEIDLNEANHADFKERIALYLTNARRVRPDGPEGRGESLSGVTGERASAIRAWARSLAADGFTVQIKDRGPVPQVLVDAYDTRAEGRDTKAFRQLIERGYVTHG